MLGCQPVAVLQSIKFSFSPTLGLELWAAGYYSYYVSHKRNSWEADKSTYVRSAPARLSQQLIA